MNNEFMAHDIIDESKIFGYWSSCKSNRIKPVQQYHEYNNETPASALIE